MRTTRPRILTALLLAAGAAALSGCVAYDPYYPTYSEPAVVAPPTVYAVPPPVVVGPGYYYRRPWHDHWHGDRGWYGRGRGWGPGGPRGWR
ncbi:hypothetical protein J2848_003991 [Azospirillum lipoferum]|uniref:Lipoprotein n=1 Tax=Azospirillum lipoferum TaxID=193 RepID=A0A5A9GCT9_AZOLI|nr:MULTISPECIES: hypothetical protein [Azospirillum]KAA0592206.1 hypothetical protein FZ942_28710 [Azospirillum lipoferum]MCP1612311.1 hypothetical protein [Azospirillum lipoferum]MDW5536467.1 hypothetical protein [Azospirillum sp. NL1]